MFHGKHLRKTKVIDDDLHKKTLQYLAMQKDVWAERRNSGDLKGIWLGASGTPDVCGLMHRGPLLPIYFGIETKSKGKRGMLTDAQKRFHKKALQWGMPILIACSLQDVVDFVAWLRGKKET